MSADLERLIEELVTMLDAVDGDPDLEDDDPAEDDTEDCCTARDDGMGFGGLLFAVLSFKRGRSALGCAVFGWLLGVYLGLGLATAVLVHWLDRLGA